MRKVFQWRPRQVRGVLQQLVEDGRLDYQPESTDGDRRYIWPLLGATVREL